MSAHIAKRIAVVSLGYLTALAASTVFLWSLASLAAYLWFRLWVKNGPSGLPPEIEFLGLLMVVSVAFSILPAAALILVAEVFGWRRLWTYLIGAVLIASLIMLMTLDWPRDVSVVVLGIPASLIASALLAGLVYWLIAGRHAGSWR